MFLIDFSRSAIRLISSELQKCKIISKNQKVKIRRPGENKGSAKDSVTSCS